MIKNILNLYPNLKQIHEDLHYEEQVKFEKYMLRQFKIESGLLDQTLQNICYPVYCKQENQQVKKKRKLK